MSEKSEKATLNTKVKAYLKKKDELLKEFELNEVSDIHFPQFREYPADLALALLVIQKHEGKFITRFLEKEK